MNPRFLLLAFPLAACSHLGPGHTVVCLSSTGADLSDGTEHFTFDVTGTLEELDSGPYTDAPLECYWEPRNGFVVRDGDGVPWTVGWGLLDQDGLDLDLVLDYTEGSEVSLRYRHVRSFGAANGFVLSDDQGPVLAVESGTWGPALEDGDVAGLSVTSGQALYQSYEECGTLEHSAITFTGEDALTLEPLSMDEVTVGGRAMGVVAVANSTWTDAECTDMAGDWMWAAYRVPEAR